MIVAEERLYELFSQIPDINGFATTYSWGDLEHLGLWLTKKKDTFPIIYQVSKSEKHHVKRRELETKWVAVLGVINPDISLTNDERWAMSFRDYLNPLASRIAESFLKCGFIEWDGYLDLERFGNYSNDSNALSQKNKSYTIENWDAIRVVADLKINDKCIKTIQWESL